ncbi:MAG TPA: SGNH/GDSL hydrolase family protein [Pseudolysinimonas sp.]|nr:SGNH/GDSL hydrolase family protein [Pseudolysinimonas sp.]
MSRALAFALLPIVVRQGRKLRRDIPRLPPPADAWSGGDSAPSALQLLVVGDSTAVGTGVESMTEALAGHLVRRLKAAGGRGRTVGWRVVGSNGATSAQVLDRHRATILSEATDIAVVLVGWNDTLRLRSGTAYAHELSALLDALRGGNPGIRMVVVAPPSFGRFTVLPQPLRAALGLHARGLARVARRVAAEFDAGYAPGFDGASLASDRFHPDGEGYRNLADGVMTALSRMPASSLGGPAAL